MSAEVVGYVVLDRQPGEPWWADHSGELWTLAGAQDECAACPDDGREYAVARVVLEVEP